MTRAKMDPRVTPARADLAAEHLRGKVKAKRFTAARRKEVTAAAAPLRTEPNEHAPLATELLRGEMFSVYQVREGWAWGQSAVDDYVGYTPVTHLGPHDSTAPRKMVHALVAPLYSAPEVTAQAIDVAYLGSLLAVTGRQQVPFIETTTGLWVHRLHVQPIPEELQTKDFIEQFNLRFGRQPSNPQIPRLFNLLPTLQALIGTPYVYGGRTPLGLDCSAFVQLLFACTGIRLPRDSDQQMAATVKVSNANFQADADWPQMEFGELLFWPGHVAWSLRNGEFAHANASRMATVQESLEDILYRHSCMGLEVIGRRRVKGFPHKA